MEHQLRVLTLQTLDSPRDGCSTTNSRLSPTRRDRRSVGRLSVGGIALAAALVWPIETLAQEECTRTNPCDTQPPVVTITPTGGSYTDPALSVTIRWTDDRGLASGSRYIQLNGVDVTSSFSYSGTTKSATSIATITLREGTNTLYADIDDMAHNFGAKTATYTLTLRTYAVAVSPDADTVVLPAQQAAIERFAIKNGSNAAVSYTLAAQCTTDGAPTSCSAAPASLSNVGPGIVASVDVLYTAGSSGSTSRVTLTATTNENTATRDSGVVTGLARTLSAQAPIGSVTDANPGITLERDLCLTIATSGDAANECGDLRIVHPLRTVRTMNKARTPFLVYSSAHAHPRRTIAANVRLADNALLPDSIIAILFNAGGGGLDTIRIAGSQWRTGSTRTRRLVFRYDSPSDATGLYRYYLQVTAKYGTTTLPDNLREGQAIIVNRSSSEFGSGWWLAGLERLSFAAGADTIVWVGGDGSARAYVRRSGSEVFVAPNVDRPDSIVRFPSFADSAYVRYLPHGQRVQFGADGFHRWTVNRLQHRTAFQYSSGRLVRIELPPDRAQFFELYYTQGLLDSATSPGPVVNGVEQRRRTSFVMQDGKVASVRDCASAHCGATDTNSVQYTYYTATRLISSRIDRRRFAHAFFYDSLFKFTRDSLAPGGTAGAIVQQYRNADSLARPRAGLAAALHLDSAYMRLDGARVDLSDVTRFLLDRYGAPRHVTDALGGSTEFHRTDPTWPALITRALYPNGRDLRATYDTRGNLATMADIDPFHDGRTAVTRFDWDPKWNFVKRITSPDSVMTWFGYDDTTGNRRWQVNDLDSLSSERRVRFDYYPNGLMRAMQTSVGRDSLTYDTRGNLEGVRSPLGYWTIHIGDEIGRLRETNSAIDSTDRSYGSAAQRTREFRDYDALDRVMQLQTHGPVVGTAPTQVATLQYAYDAESNADTVARFSLPDPRGVGIIRTRWIYDGAGRKTIEIAPDGKADTIEYDPAGNKVRLATRRGLEIRTKFDALNRMLERALPQAFYPDTTYGSWRFPLYSNCGGTALCVPADTARFTYDAAGNLLSAYNRDARIRRSYFKNGAIETDSLVIRTWEEASQVAEAWTRHVYGLRYGYNRSNQRIWLKLPRQLGAQLAASPGVVFDSIAYSHDPRSGLLTRVRDVLGNEYRYAYDSDGQVDTLYYPQGHFKRFVYDTDARLTATHLDRTTTAEGVKSVTMFYDARDRMLRGVSPPPGVCGTARPLQMDNQYDGLGVIVSSKIHCDSGDYDQDTWTTDALGNRTGSTYNGADPDLGGGARIREGNSHSYSYHFGVGRLLGYTEFKRSLVRVNDPNASPSCWSDDNETVQNLFDRSGNQYWKAERLFRIARTWSNFFWNCVGSNNEFNFRSASYYGADEKLRVLDYRSEASGSVLNADLPRSGFEEYRYDALGRRVVRRLRDNTQTCDVPENCNRLLIQRFVWDDQAIVAEIQYPGGASTVPYYLGRDTVTLQQAAEHWGRVLYTHGLALDQPLSVTRVGYSRKTHESHPEVEGSVPQFWEPLSVGLDWNWRGEPIAALFYGPTPRCKSSGPCALLRLPTSSVFYSYNLDADPEKGWFGSLLRAQRDGTGQIFRRNRYYEPRTGRFTQEDPIGLAGGINLYGFANGDPVNYSDPFGLCPVPWLCSAAVGAAVGLGATMWYNYQNNRPLNDNLVRNTLIGAAGGALLGQTLTTAGGGLHALREHMRVPGYARSTLSHIRTTGTAPPGFKGGKPFANDGRRGGEILPRTDAKGNPISYREWDVKLYQRGVNRGDERLVTGSDGSAYYTSDHYTTFIKVP